MKHLLKLLHLASMAAFAGALMVSLVLADSAEGVTAAGVASVRRSIAVVGEAVVVPSLIVLLVTGMLLVVARPNLIHARWVWAKAALGTVAAAVALFVVLPAERHAAIAANEGSLGAPSLDLMQRAAVRVARHDADAGAGVARRAAGGLAAAARRDFTRAARPHVEIEIQKLVSWPLAG